MKNTIQADEYDQNRECGHFALDRHGNCQECGHNPRQADMARAFNEGVLAQREATRAAGGDVGQIVKVNPYAPAIPPAEETR